MAGKHDEQHMSLAGKQSILAAVSVLALLVIVAVASPGDSVTGDKHLTHFHKPSSSRSDEEEDPDQDDADSGAEDEDTLEKEKEKVSLVALSKGPATSSESLDRSRNGTQAQGRVSQKEIADTKMSIAEFATSLVTRASTWMKAHDDTDAADAKLLFANSAVALLQAAKSTLLQESDENNASVEHARVMVRHQLQAALRAQSEAMDGTV